MSLVEQRFCWPYFWKYFHYFDFLRGFMENNGPNLILYATQKMLLWLVEDLFMISVNSGSYVLYYRHLADIKLSEQVCFSLPFTISPSAEQQEQVFVIYRLYSIYSPCVNTLRRHVFLVADVFITPAWGSSWQTPSARADVDPDVDAYISSSVFLPLHNFITELDGLSACVCVCVQHVCVCC